MRVAPIKVRWLYCSDLTPDPLPTCISLKHSVPVGRGRVVKGF